MSHSALRRWRRAVVAATAAGVTLSGTVAVADAQEVTVGRLGWWNPPPRVVDLQLLAFNDLHGNLEPPAGGSGRVTVPATPPATGTATVDTGGAAYLATHVRQLSAQNPNTLVMSTGDHIGASPLVSALFHDEPTIEAMNLMDVDVAVVGNHEFDEGVPELLRMQFGGCHPGEGCFGGDGFEGSAFPHLAANVIEQASGRSLFDPYRIFDVQGVPVAVVGVVLEETPTIVSPAGVAGLDFRDEADTVNALVPELRRQGVETIVVLMHQGGTVSGTTINECGTVSGPVADIVPRFDDEVDVVFTAHTHQAYNCRIDGKVVIQGASFGRLLSKVDLRIDRVRREVIAATATNVPVTRTVAPAADVAALIERYRALARPLAQRVIGQVTADLVRTPGPGGQSPLGGVIADAQLAATRAQGAQVAFMNPGGIRADLLFAPSGGEAPGAVTYEEAFTVQPFANSLVTLTLTGAQIDTLLEQQWQGQSSPRILQVSEGFSYRWNPDAPVGQRVDPATIRLAGQPLDLAASYRVTVNSFLAEGGDNFLVLTQGTNRVGGDVDVDAFEAYLSAGAPVAPAPTDRIQIGAGGAPAPPATGGGTGSQDGGATPTTSTTSTTAAPTPSTTAAATTTTVAPGPSTSTTTATATAGV